MVWTNIYWVITIRVLKKFLIAQFSILPSLWQGRISLLLFRKEYLFYFKIFKKKIVFKLCLFSPRTIWFISVSDRFFILFCLLYNVHIISINILFLIFEIVFPWKCTIIFFFILFLSKKNKLSCYISRFLNDSFLKVIFVIVLFEFY